MCAATVKMQTFLHPISCIPLEGGSLAFQPHPPPLPAPFVDNGLFGPRPPETQSRPASRAWLDVLFHFTAKRTNQNAVRTFIHICRNRKPRCGIIVKIIDLYIFMYRYKESGYYTFHLKKKKITRERKWSYREIYFLTCLRQTMNKHQQTPASGQPGESLPNPKHVPFLLILSATK